MGLGMMTPHKGFHQAAAGLVEGVAELAGLLRRERERLFAEAVLAGAGAVQHRGQRVAELEAVQQHARSSSAPPRLALN